MPAINFPAESRSYLEVDLFPARGLWWDLHALGRSWVPPTLAGPEELLVCLETSIVPVLTSRGGVAVSISGLRGSGPPPGFHSVQACSHARPLSVRGGVIQTSSICGRRGPGPFNAPPRLSPMSAL